MHSGAKEPKSAKLRGKLKIDVAYRIYAHGVERTKKILHFSAQAFSDTEGYHMRSLGFLAVLPDFSQYAT